MSAHEEQLSFLEVENKGLRVAIGSIALEEQVEQSVVPEDMPTLFEL